MRRSRGQLRLSAMTRGVVVTDVAQGTPAAWSGLQPGDVIQEVDHARVNTTNDFDRALRRAPGHTVLLLVNRQGGTFTWRSSRDSGTARFTTLLEPLADARALGSGCVYLSRDR